MHCGINLQMFYIDPNYPFLHKTNPFNIKQYTRVKLGLVELLLEPIIINGVIMRSICSQSSLTI